MNASQISLHKSLLAELADIERQQHDLTLSHSDQQLLDQAWEDVTNRLDELDTIVESDAEEDWRDARVALEDYEGRPPTPRPSSPVRIAPPPPRSVTLAAGIDRHGNVVAQMPDGRWVPAPPPLFVAHRPPPIEIPRVGGSPSMAPPPPRPGGATICNCDSDGECVYCEEERLNQEELERWNNMVDDREGCARCAGCFYCRDEGGYDGADEV